MSEQTSRQQIPAALANHAKSIVVRPVDYQIVDVEVNLTEGLSSYLEEYFESAVLRYQQQGASLVPFTIEDLRRYVLTLIHSRIQWVRNERGYALHYSDRVVVPSFLSFVLSGIGRVEIPELGLALVPLFRTQVEVTDESGVIMRPAVGPLMTKEEAIVFSNRLRELNRLGFEFAEGYARDKTGAFDLMVLQLIGDQIVSHTDKAHPAYSVAAYFLGMLQVVPLLGPRVLYGTSDQMRWIMRMVAAE